MINNNRLNNDLKDCIEYSLRILSLSNLEGIFDFLSEEIAKKVFEELIKEKFNKKIYEELLDIQTFPIHWIVTKDYYSSGLFQVSYWRQVIDINIGKEVDLDKILSEYSINIFFTLEEAKDYYNKNKFQKK